MEEKKNLCINLGGGEETIDGFLNIDIVDLPSVDIVADISKGIPLPDNCVKKVRAFYILEHIPNTAAIMEELYRVCQPGARLKIKIPYFKSTAAFKDPTHTSFFTEKTFEYFDQDFIKDHRLPNYQKKYNFKLVKLTYNYYSRGTRFLPFAGLLRRFFWDVVKNIIVELEVMK